MSKNLSDEEEGEGGPKDELKSDWNYVISRIIFELHLAFLILYNMGDYADDRIRPIGFENDDESPAAKLGKRMRCSVCPRSRDRKTKNGCDRCLQPVCNDHRTNICFNCVMTSCFTKSLSALQTFSRFAQFRRISQSLSSMNLAVPQPDGQPKTFSPKIEEIANNIAQLNLIEVAELSDLLKKKLNLPDATPMMNFAGIPAAPKEQEEEKEPEGIRSNYALKLNKFDASQKIALIKEIKVQLQDLNLVQAKKLVESAPVILRENLEKAEADKLVEALTKVGGEIEIV